MQLRMNGIKLNKKPKFLTHNSTEEHHSIQYEENSKVKIIPLLINGVTS